MTSIARVKERAEEQSSAMSGEQQAIIRMVANDLHRLNQSVMKAVEAGVLGGAGAFGAPPWRRRQLGRPARAGDRYPGAVQRNLKPQCNLPLAFGVRTRKASSL